MNTRVGLPKCLQLGVLRSVLIQVVFVMGSNNSLQISPCSTDISVRDIHSWTDKVMNFSDFVLQSRSISSFAEEGGQQRMSFYPLDIYPFTETERLYGKDAECPHAWEKWLEESNVLPTSVLSHGNADEFRFRPASVSFACIPLISIIERFLYSHASKP